MLLEEDVLLDSHRREVTVLFVDLRGFTAFTEATEPDAVMTVLREFHHALGDLIHKYEGTLERFAGDGLMTLFNDPLTCDDHTERAVRLAVDSLTKGGKAIVVGLFGGDITLPTPFIPMRAMTLQGSYVGSLAEATELLALVKRARIPAITITRRPLDGADAALQDLRAGRLVGRAVLVP